jgi:hypothetical protein
MLSRAVVLAVLAGFVGAGGAWAKPRVEHGRYYSPDSDFSIDVDSMYPPTHEYLTEHVTLVEFSFTPQATIYGLVLERSVEWLKLDHAVPQERYEAAAQGIIEDNKAHRFQPPKFELKSAQLLTDGPVPRYVFVAIGRLQGTRYAWHGVVLFYGDRAALASEIMAPVRDLSGERLDAMLKSPFMRWALSLKEETRTEDVKAPPAPQAE